MPLGIFYNGISSKDDFLQISKKAEELGVDSLWIAEHFGYRDAFVISAEVLGHTNKIRVIPGPISPYSRHPMVIAMGMATLIELAPGRVSLLIGTGDPGTQGKFGIEVKHAPKTMVEAIEIIRELMKGQPVDFDGERFMLHDASINFNTTSIPIYLAAMGPLMLRTSGIHSDGVVLSVALSPNNIEKSIKKSQEGFDFSWDRNRPFKRVGWFLSSLASTSKEAYALVKEELCHFLARPTSNDDFDHYHIHVDHESIKSALKIGDLDSAASYVHDELVEHYTVSGSPQQFKKQLLNFIDAGVDYPVLGLIGTLENQCLAIKLALEACA